MCQNIMSISNGKECCNNFKADRKINMELMFSSQDFFGQNIKM